MKKRIIINLTSVLMLLCFLVCSGTVAAATELDQEISTVTFENAFPDESFRTFINESIFTVPLSAADVLDEAHQLELQSYTGHINLSGKRISDMTGLSYLKKITSLDVSGNYLPVLDISECKMLAVLDCSDNDLIELNLLENTEIRELYCQYNKISKLDLSKNSKLKVLNIYQNALLGFCLNSFVSDGLTTLVSAKMTATLCPKMVGTQYGIILPEEALAPVTSSLPNGARYLTGSRAIVWSRLTSVPPSFTYEYVMGGSAETIRVTVYMDKTNIVESAVNVYTPADFTAKSNAYNKIKLSWKKVAGATGYRLYRATTKAGTYSLIKTVKSNTVLTYTDAGLVCGKKYYYQITAYREIEGTNYVSVKSDIISRKPIPNKTTVALKRLRAKSITITWKKKAGATGYIIYRSSTKNGTYQRVKTVSRAKASWTNGRLARGKTYYYKVRVYRKVNGKKVYSNYSAIKGKAA